jgi:hypothetical protein
LDRKLTSDAAGQLVASKPRDKGRYRRSSDAMGRTSVKPEQASKVQLRMPTRRDRGRQHGWGRQSTEAPVRSAGVVGTARRKGDAGNVGDPLGWGLSSIAAAMRTRWESERVIVPVKPGNAGGGKGPCFRRAFEEVEER